MVDNIFSSLGHRRTSGVVKEFVLWCIVCFVAVMSLVAAIVGRGNITWIMMMIFSIGLGVLMAFRLRAISVLYCMGVFNLLTFVIHYVSFSGIGYGYSGYSAFNTVLFILLLLTSLALVVCGFIHFFSRFNLSLVLLILEIADASVMILLHILMYVAGYWNSDPWDSTWSYYRSNDGLHDFLNYRGYWIGTITFWILLVVVVLLCIFFFRGMLGNRNEKIIRVHGSGSSGRGSGAAPGIMGLTGIHTGRTMYIQGKTITIGRGEGVTIRILDSTVGQKHCAIRFDGATNFYQVLDYSTNGVYLSNGSALPKNTWYSVQRGSVICIASKENQFRLL